MRTWLLYFFILVNILFISCIRESNPVKDEEIVDSTEIFQNFLLHQESYTSFSLKTNGEIILSDPIVTSIVYSEYGDDTVSFSTEIPFSFSEVEAGFSLNYSFTRRGVNPNTDIDFEISYHLINYEAVKIDSTILMKYLSKDDMEIVLDVADLGSEFQGNSSYNFDLTDSCVIFSTWSPQGLYSYNLMTKQINQLLPQSIIYFASYEQYIFYYIENEGVFRYNLDSLKIDLKVDLSQLEYEVDYCRTINTVFDTLAIALITDLDYTTITRIAYFDTDGNYLSSFTETQPSGGFNGNHAKYGKLIFIGSDTGWWVYDFVDDFYYKVIIDKFGPGWSNIRIKSDGSFYCMDYYDKLIGKVQIEKILEVLF